MVTENSTASNVQNVVSRSLGVYFFVKNIFFALIFLAIIIFMFFVGVQWYYVLIFVAIGGFVIFMSLRRSLRAARGLESGPQTITKYTIGKGFSTVERY